MNVEMTEKELLEAVRQYARLCGWLVYHTHDSRRSEPGFPDLVMVRPTTIYFVELKGPRGRLTIEQRRWMRELEQVEERAPEHVRTAVWRPQDWWSGLIEKELR